MKVDMDDNVNNAMGCKETDNILNSEPALSNKYFNILLNMYFLVKKTKPRIEPEVKSDIDANKKNFLRLFLLTNNRIKVKVIITDVKKTGALLKI